MASKISEKDRETIEEQLGYYPKNLLQVAAYHTRTLDRTELTEPAVLLLYPLRPNEDAYKPKQRTAVVPFPTIYWLSSPYLKERISNLEKRGYIQVLQERLQASKADMETIHRQHQSYAQKRMALLDEKDAELSKHRGWERLESTGIAGIQNWDSVKCLHTHYAHYLATHDNIIGEWVDQLLQDKCDEDSSA